MEVIMKRIVYALIFAAVLATACHQPEYVLPTAERQGISSLVAYFTFGPYADQEMGRLEISDPELDRYIIPIPWYFPESSDDITTPYMTKIRVRATLQPNCSIDPPLTILDLTEENHFRYTDATGAKRDIIISGERVRSSKCELISFTIQHPMINGIIDKSKGTVSLITANDLSVARASATVSAHATISPDPSEAHNYNEGFTYTVTADDGVTKAEYFVVKNVPEKIDYGVNGTSLEKLFNMDPSSGLGLPGYKAVANVSMAVLDSWLIVNMGDGSAPRYYNKIVATPGGTLNIGTADPSGSIASDEQDHLLICNLAQKDETFSIWTTSSVTKAPELLLSFTNDMALPIGQEMKVIGDISKEAVITVTYPGVAGVTTSGFFRAIHIVGGEIVSNEIIDLYSANGFCWGAGTPRSTCVVAGSPQMDMGWYSIAYSENTLYWFKPDLSIGSASPGEGDGSIEDAPGGGYFVNGNVDPNNLDTKQFNNGRFLALFVSTHFPQWWPGPQLYVFDITGSSISGNIFNSPQLVFSVPFMFDQEYQSGASDGNGACGDVILAPSADGYMLYIYYYDHYCQMIGGYSMDCIKR